MITDGTKISKFLSLILRHKPETIGLVLDENGWAETTVLLQGLLKQSRHQVHLSEQFETAKSVGMRYGKPVVLKILARAMQDSGIQFFRSENGVWLTEYVDATHIQFDDSI
jgi:RNA:NAD 2'-phosphotransferase (TPT1/KptA family)